MSNIKVESSWEASRSLPDVTLNSSFSMRGWNKAVLTQTLFIIIKSISGVKSSVQHAKPWNIYTNRLFQTTPGLLVYFMALLSLFFFLADTHSRFLCVFGWSMYSFVGPLVGSCGRRQETEAWGIPRTSRNILSGLMQHLLSGRREAYAQTRAGGNVGQILALGSNIWMRWVSIYFSTFKLFLGTSSRALLEIRSLKSP